MVEVLKVQLRLPADVHQWLVKWSKQNDRSMNGQMVAMLREKMRELDNRDGPTAGTLGG